MTVSEFDGGRARRPIVIVDDDEDLVACLRALLEEAGYPVIASASGDEALAACDRDPALVLLDLHLPGPLTGEALVAALRMRLDPAVRVLLLSGETGVSNVAAALRVDGFLEKPFEVADLLRVVGRHARD